MSKVMDFEIRVKMEGERAFTTGMRSFLRDNRGSFALSEAKKIRRLRKGQEFCAGGGAAPEFCVTRPGTRSHLGGMRRRRSKRSR